MKKLLILILICCAQNMFSQKTKPASKTKTSPTKSTEPVIVKVSTHYDDSNITVDDGPVNNTTLSDKNHVYNTMAIDVKPDFPGGIEKFYSFVDNNFKKPEEEDLKGKVYLTFVVEKDGALTDIKVLRDIGYGTGAEAIRVLKKCPKWIPGELNGKKVRVLYSLPIIIK
jgi:hypothetical protein